MALYDSTGSLFATYDYDAWGKVLRVSDANGNLITSTTNFANINPFRYRGYYYDTDSELYYLQSRYYDPTTGRFVNADGYISTGTGLMGYNMFSYCNNNPVNAFDPSGYSSETVDQLLYYFIKLLYGLLFTNSAKSNNSTPNKDRANSLPTTGEPNSSQELENSDGTIKQKRWYGPDGSAVRDRDFNHTGNMEFPHDHEWVNGKRNKEHLPPSPEYQISWEPVVGIGITAVCVVGIAYFALNDISGVGVIDDPLIVPLQIGVMEGLKMASA